MTGLRGGVSGGTLASLIGQQDEVRVSAERRRVVHDPHALSSDRAAEPDLGGEPELEWVRYDGDLRIWTGPFAMAGINTRVVRRSNALQGWAYGRRFPYREVTGFGAGSTAPMLATTFSATLKSLEAGLAFGPSRACSARCCQHPAGVPANGPAAPAISECRSTAARRRGHGTWARSGPKGTRDMPPPR